MRDVLRTEAMRRPNSGAVAILLTLLAGWMTGCLAHRSDLGPESRPRDPLEVADLAPAINPEGTWKPSDNPARPKRNTDAQSRDKGVTQVADRVPSEKSDPPPTSSMPEDRPGVAARAADTPSPIPVVGQPYPIDLAAALRLADAENPTIAVARVAVLEALAQQMAARAILLPSLNGGANYHGHEGNLQRSSGRILNLSEQSLYFGGGARTLAAESVAIPAVNIFSPLTEAIYEPLAAKQRVAGSRFEAAATANAVLLEVADLYMEMLGTEAALDARRRTAAEGDDIARITRDFAIQGEGRPADADRADIERRLLQAEVQRGEEDVALASARLSRRLNLDPAIRLRTLNVPLAPIQLIDASLPSEDLIVDALTRRPDLAARNASIGFAEAKLREEKARPLLPTIWLGFSGGVEGGGSNLVPPDLAHFGGRTDFDVRAYWTLLNFGAGNVALQRGRRAEVGQAEAERARTMNRIRSEVLASKARALSQAEQVVINRTALVSAEKGYSQDRALLRESLSRPIEAVNSLRLVNTARLNLIRSIVRANQAQLALFVSLGSPPPLSEGTPTVAFPPVATPIRTPIVERNDRAAKIPPPPPPVLGH